MANKIVGESWILKLDLPDAIMQAKGKSQQYGELGVVQEQGCYSWGVHGLKKHGPIIMSFLGATYFQAWTSICQTEH